MHWQNLCYILKHKWFVLIAGLRLGVPLWQLLIHDWSKFTPAEWGPYARKFFRNHNDLQLVEREALESQFKRAWLHHLHHNPHHWEHWIIPKGVSWNDRTFDLGIQRMPFRYAKEMVADWAGAGRAINGEWEVIDWYAQQHDKIILHPETREVVEQLLRVFDESEGPQS